MKKKSDKVFLTIFFIVMLMINNGVIEVVLTQWNSIVHKTKVSFVDKNKN